MSTASAYVSTSTGLGGGHYLSFIHLSSGDPFVFTLPSPLDWCQDKPAPPFSGTKAYAFTSTFSGTKSYITGSIGTGSSTLHLPSHAVMAIVNVWISFTFYHQDRG